MQTRKWQDQSGNDRYKTEIVANEMQMLGGKGSGVASMPESTSGSEPEPVTAGTSNTDDFDDDIPF